jgi:hypothetical protein
MRMPTSNELVQISGRASTRGDPSEIALRPPLHEMWSSRPQHSLSFPPFLSLIAVLALTIWVLLNAFGRAP